MILRPTNNSLTAGMAMFAVEAPVYRWHSSVRSILMVSREGIALQKKSCPVLSKSVSKQIVQLPRCPSIQRVKHPSIAS